MGYIIRARVSTHKQQVLKSVKKEVRRMDDHRLTPRKRQILRAIVDAHINHGEPVGSKYLATDANITCSPATIRNEMADLESMGYLIQPHTSAGRVPSELGYRFYVDSLIRQYGATRSEIDEIQEKLRYKLTEMDAILEEVSRLAASFTDYTGFAFKMGGGNVQVERFDSVYVSSQDFLLVMMFAKDVVKAKTVHVPTPLTPDDLVRFTKAANMYLTHLSSSAIALPVIVKLETLMGECAAMVHPTVKVIYETMNEFDTADIRVEGVNKLLNYPEYSDVGQLRSLLGMIEEKDQLLDVISTKTAEADNDIHIYIGTEEASGAMSKTTLIYKNVRIGGREVSVGVIGPKRMNYSKVIGMINSLANGIDRLFNGKESDRGLPAPYYDRRKKQGD